MNEVISLTQLRHELSNIAIEKDDFARWKDAKVTRAFLLHFAIQIMEEADSQIGMCEFDLNKIAIQTVRKEARLDAFNDVLEWNPSEVGYDS